jgi:hypothetical protein
MSDLATLAGYMLGDPVPRPPVFRKDDRTPVSGRAELHAAILDMIEDCESVSVADILAALSVTEKPVRQAINELSSAGKIARANPGERPAMWCAP